MEHPKIKWYWWRRYERWEPRPIKAEIYSDGVVYIVPGYSAALTQEELDGGTFGQIGGECTGMPEEWK